MIPKVLFLALFCVAHVQARPAIFPRLNESVENDSSVSNNPVADAPERSGQDKPIVNDWTNVDYEDYANDNLNPSEIENGNANVPTIRSRPEVNEKVSTHRVATNDEANNIPVDDRAPSIVTEKIATARPVTERRIRKPHVAKLADALGQAIDEVVRESVHSLNRDIGSVLEVERSVVGAAGTIVQSKIELVLSVPGIGEQLFASLRKI